MENEIRKNRDIQRLVIEVLSKDERRDKVQFKISAQTLRGPWFGDDNQDEEIGLFRHPKMNIMSSAAPEIRMSDRILYVRGSNVDSDDTILVCNVATLNRVMSAVTMFNKRFKGSPEPIIDNTGKESA